MAHPTELDALYAFLVAAAVTALLTPLSRCASRGPSARSTSRASAASPSARRRCSAAWRSSPACSSPALIWLPAGYAQEHQLWHGVLLAAAVITLVGALDDRFELPPAVKLAGPGAWRR